MIVTKQRGQAHVYQSLTQTTNHVKCEHNNGNIRTTTTKKIGKEETKKRADGKKDNLVNEKGQTLCNLPYSRMFDTE